MARSFKKGPYVEPSLIEKVKKAKSAGKREAIKTWSRRSMVTPDFVGLTFAVHNGRKFISVFIVYLYPSNSSLFIYLNYLISLFSLD